MGRVKTAQIKRLSNELREAHPTQFSNKFDENKKKVMDLTDVESKKLRNLIAGQITKLQRRKEE
jgi:small subunit ribosomal protein S17e